MNEHSATATIRRDRRLNFEPRTSNFELGNGPPFNDSDWFRKDNDVRWQFGVPPKGNANFVRGSMSSSQPGEGATQRTHIKADWEISRDEMRTTNRVFPTSTFEIHPSNFAPLPGQLFYSTKIPVCLWFLAKNKNADAKRGFRDRLGLENQLALAA